MIGKKLRNSRFHYQGSQRGVIVPIDHGLTLGPIDGIKSVRQISQWIQSPAICGIIAHKGMAERLVEADLLRGKGLMIHLNGMSTLGASPDNKVMLTSVEVAARLGADAVSIQVNFDGTNDVMNMRTLGIVADEASKLSVPLLAMVYDKVKSMDSTTRLHHLIRMSLELGCDAVKIGPPESMELLQEYSDDIQIYIAGGNLSDEKSVYDLTRKIAENNLSGLCVGRNVFQRSNSGSLLQKMKEILTEATPSVKELTLQRGLAYGLN